MPETNRDEIAKLETLYASNPEGRVFTHLAEAYRKAGEFDRARAILEQGLGKHPGYASAYVVLGRVYFDLNDMQQATDSFRRVLDLDPHNLVALRTLGDIARAAGRRDEAIEYFQELRHQDPNNGEIEGILAELRTAPEVPVPEATPESAVPMEPETERVASISEMESVTPVPIFEEALPPAVAENLPEFDMPARDYGDLVASDGEWEPQLDAADDVLPGDLADFASLIESAPQAAPEPEPIPDLPDFELPEPAAAEIFIEPEFAPPVFDEMPEPVTELEPDSSDATSPPPIPELPAATGELMTETMAMLYRDQGLYERSAEVYRALLKDRPGDWALQAGLHEVERLANEAEPPSFEAPEAPPAASTAPANETFEPIQFTPTAPEAAAEPSAIELDEEPASPWVSAKTPATESPGLYSFTDEPSEEEAGAPIAQYFQGLLAWKPNGNGQAQSSFAPAPEMVEEEHAVLDLDMPADTAEQPMFEEPAVAEAAPVTELPPAVPADGLMPWEEPASPSMPDAPVIPPPTPARAEISSDNPVDSAFDEWFNSTTPPSAATVDALPSLRSAPPTPPTPVVAPAPPPTVQQPPAPVSPPPTPAAPAFPSPQSSESGGEDDDDLEMFRSWLQSLKK